MATQEAEQVLRQINGDPKDVPAQLFGELESLLQQNGELQQRADAAEARAASAEAEVKREKDAAQRKEEQAAQLSAAAKAQMETALQMQLSALPHVNRYVTFGTTNLASTDPLFTKLAADFSKSLTRHRGPRQGDPHRATPKLEVTRIQRICVPRLQEKYLVQLQDMAGLCEQKVTPISGVQAQKVCSVTGLQMNEYLMYHGAPSDLVERLYKQGLDPRYAGEHFGKLFGEGTYLATNASKSDIYTKPNDDGERCILLVRACLGEPQLAKQAMSKARKPAERLDGRGTCDSVVALTQSQGGCVEHPEYIVYREWQTLPQFAIWCAPDGKLPHLPSVQLRAPLAVLHLDT